MENTPCYPDTFFHFSELEGPYISQICPSAETLFPNPFFSNRDLKLQYKLQEYRNRFSKEIFYSTEQEGSEINDPIL